MQDSKSPSRSQRKPGAVATQFEQSPDERLKPFRNRLVQFNRFPILKHGHPSVADAQVVIIVDQYVGEFTDCDSEVFQRARKSRVELLQRNIMATLRCAHGNAMGRPIGA